MSNSYTAIPNIIPGNLTVTGILTVQGNELRVGSTTPYVRIVKQSGVIGAFTVNLGQDLLTRDDPTVVGYAAIYNPSIRAFGARTVNLAGSVQSAAARFILMEKAQVISGTGAGGDLTLVSRTILANMLGTNSLFRLRLWVWASTVAGGGLQFNANFGGTAFPQVTVGPSVLANFVLEFVFMANNSLSANVLGTYTFGVGSTPAGGSISSSINTAIDQALLATVHFLNAADSASVLGYEGVLLNSYGPV